MQTTVTTTDHLANRLQTVFDTAMRGSFYSKVGWQAVAAEVLKGACRQRMEPGVAMDFGTAINCIKDGESVTRMGYVYNRDNLYQVTPRDMMAEDWEVVFPLV